MLLFQQSFQHIVDGLVILVFHKILNFFKLGRFKQFVFVREIRDAFSNNLKCYIHNNVSFL